MISQFALRQSFLLCFLALAQLYSWCATSLDEHLVITRKVIQYNLHTNIECSSNLNKLQVFCCNQYSGSTGRCEIPICVNVYPCEVKSPVVKEGYHRENKLEGIKGLWRTIWRWSGGQRLFYILRFPRASNLLACCCSLESK